MNRLNWRCYLKLIYYSLTLILGVRSTPRASGFTLSTFFFLAFMILGRVAYLGSLSLRSAERTAGRLILIVSRPPSTSRVTVRPASVFSTLDAKTP